MTPAWAGHAIWWSVYPLGACGAPIRTPDAPGVHHRLRRLEAWLDHLVGLGCNGLALGPVWASTTHGYDVTDHGAIDPRLGDDADFDHLVQACHARGVRVLLDGVFNHVSSAHPLVAAVRSGAPNQWFRTDPAQPDGLSRFEGHAGLVELDHARPAVATLVTDIMSQWLARGADGWRLDAAYRVPAAFWAGVLAEVRTAYPEALILAEVLHGDYAAIADAAGFDSITQYELWKAIWSACKDRNPFELAWALARHERTRGHLLPWTFVGNHDVTRIATQVGPAAPVAQAILMTLPGMPALYYGDEAGWTGLKQDCLGGDDAIRPALPDEPRWTPDEAAAIRLTQLAVRFRRTHPWIATATTQVVATTQHHLVWRTSTPTGEWIETSLDLTAQPGLDVRDAMGPVLRVGSAA